MKSYNIKGMKIKKSLGLALSLAIAPASLFTFTSCEDFLTITPTDAIVEEEFWQDKNDLNNALMGCYKSMTESSYLNRVIFWGETRSDNCDRSLNLGSTSQLANIMNANLLTTYDSFDWTPMYKTINLCNKILNHGEEVVKTDESFSQQNWLPIKAEAIALRSLSYFYLVRAFGEIPYIAETRKTAAGNDTIVHIDINNDSQNLCYPQMTQLAVINNIISDLESIKDIAMNEYGNTVANKGRITKKAVLTMLADAYLWRASYLQGKCHPFVNRSANEYSDVAVNGPISNGYDDTVAGTTYQEDYQKCIDYCDAVIKMSSDELVKKLEKQFYGTGTLRPELCDLIAQYKSETEIGMHLTTGRAYNSIFGTGNSDESIFELQFDGVTYSNGMLSDCFMNPVNTRIGWFCAPKSLFESVAANPNAEKPDYVFTKTDYRRWESIYREPKDGQTEYNYAKMALSSITQYNAKSTSYLMDNTQPVTSGTNMLEVLNSFNSSNNSNYIIYRLTEVYLMKAEAMSQIYDTEEKLTEAFNYVREVYKRSNVYAYEKTNQTAGSDTLKTKLFTNQKSLEFLVMAERQREFLCEGKRWFDLVRFAQRRGSTSEMLDLLVRKYQGNQKSVRAKLADIQSLFCPVYEQELKANYLLYQNGAWQKSKTTGRTDNK